MKGTEGTVGTAGTEGARPHWLVYHALSGRPFTICAHLHHLRFFLRLFLSWFSWRLGGLSFPVHPYSLGLSVIFPSHQDFVVGP
jgi:hypothetical protein